MSDVLNKQSLLQQRAVNVIDRLRLNDLLAKYGEYYLTGSVSYGTVHQRDIDFKLKLSDHSSESLFNLAHELFDREGVYVVHIHNITGFRDMEGFALKASLTDDYAEKWNIDIMIEKTRFETDKQFNQQMQQVSDAEREIILELKQAVFEPGKEYRDLSPTIYKAVIEEGVTTKDEFEKYLHKINRSIRSFEKAS